MTVGFQLVLGHFIADFVFQNESMAKFKSHHQNHRFVPWLYWMFAHASVHSLMVGLITGSQLLALLELTAHFLIDHFKCEGLFNLHVDQGLHVGCKALWVILL